MQAAASTSRIQLKSVVALGLTFGAGVVDIVGYIAVYHTFVAHMTGNTVHLGNKLASGEWEAAAKAACTIASFIVGSVAGRAVIEMGARRRQRTIASFTLAAEAVLVIAFVWVGERVLPSNPALASSPAHACGLLALLAAAMGLQTATLTRVGPLTVHTTFVTGMLNKFAQASSEWLFWAHDQWQDRATMRDILQASRRNPAFHNAAFVLTIWVAYMIGAVAGTWMNSRWRLEAMYVPVAILFLSIAVDQFRPLSLEEEREQV